MSALKVLSLRLRGMKGQLEELGEETDENVENISKMQGQILNMTKGKVNIFDSTGNFKSTYEIMQGIAQVWDDLSSIDQADLLETIAGKHRANDVAALLSNWENVEAAVKSASEAEGSAAKENAKYIDSIQGRLDKLTTVWQSFANTFIETDFAKGAISGLTKFVELIEKLVDNVGTLGTIGLGAGIFGIFKNRSSFSGILGSLSAFGQLASEAWRSGGKLTTRFKDIGKAAGMAGGDIAKSFTGSLSGMIGGIGLAIAAIGLIVNAYKNYKEEISRARQETIQASDEFLDAAGSFEQVYIKYSGKTSLTAEEESELSSAINGTVDALDDKSSALQGVVNSSNDYLTSLERIKRAELEAAEAAAKKKRDNAELELKDAVKGWSSSDGSEVDIFLDSTSLDTDLSETNEIVKIAKEIGEKYYKINRSGKDNQIKNYSLVLDANASAEEILDYYYTLVEYQERLSEADLIDTQVYEKVTSIIDTMSESIGVYTDGVYEAVKAQYQLQNGIPTTAEEYLKMREAVLKHNDIKGLTIDTKKTIAGTLDSDTGQAFDLSSAYAQSRQLVGILDEYGDIEAHEIETFLNMRTKVNGNECTVGDYMSQFDDINTMTEDWSQEAKDELNTTFGLDTDTIKEQYDKVYNYLQNKNLSVLNSYENTPEFRLEKDNIKEQEIKDFLDGLSVYELEAVANLKGEIDWETESFDNIIKQIEEEAKIIEALSFSINIDIETEKLENLTAAISESFSGAGLGTESMSLVKDMFGDLDNYDPSLLFERTSTGMRLNREELKKLNDEYKNTNVDGLENKMSALGDRYLQVRDELSDLTYGSEEYKQKSRELSDIESQINATETLIAQYEGLTNAYSEWQRVESSGQERDMYESVIEGFENVGDEISRGWIDDGSIEFLELMTGRTDLAALSAKELKKVWKGLDDTIKHTTYSVKDFFTVDEDGNSTSQGVFNFLDAVGQLEEEKFGGKDVVKRDKNGRIIEFDFQFVGGNKAIAEALGVSEELVDIMVRAADDAGFVVSMDGTYQQLDVLKKKAQEAANALKDTFKKTKFEFDLDTRDEGSIKKQYQEALKIWEPFTKNKKADGTIDMSVKGAEEAFTLVSTLQSMVDKLSEPVYMELDATQVEKDMQTPLSKLQEYERLVQSEHQLRLKGTDTSELEADKEEIINYFDELQENSPEIAAELGIKDLSREEIQAKVESGEIEIPATIDLQVEMNNTLRDMVNIALYNAGLLGEGEEGKAELEKRVDISLYADKVDTSDVEEKTEEEVEKATKENKRKTNIEIIAEVFGVNDVDDLSEKLKGLDDETVQAIAKVLGQTDVDSLKQTLATLGAEDKIALDIIAKAMGEGDVESLKEGIDKLSSKTVEAIAKALGYSSVEELKSSVASMDGNTVQAVAQALGLSDVNTLQITINNMQGNTVDAKVNTDGQASKISALQEKINGLKGKVVNVIVNTIKTIASGGKKKAAQRTGADPAGNDSEANGTARINGTTGRAFKQGSWGTKNSGTALVGELGREVLVRDGRYYTIGDNGAEFIKYKKGDIIFNHVQSEQLFRNGKVTSGGGRAKAFVSGTAFSNGSGGGIEPEVNSKTAGSSSSESKFEETIDWIETILDRAERAIDKYEKQSENVYKTWTKRNKALEKEISEVDNTISLYEQAKNKYESEFNSIGLEQKYVDRIKYGLASGNDAIEDFEDENDEKLVEKIKNYQDLYEKYLDCIDKIDELKETEASLYSQRFDNVQSEYDNLLQGFDHTQSMLDEYISQAEAKGQIVSKNYYAALIDNEEDRINTLKQEQTALIKARDEAVANNEFDKYSEDWYRMCAEIDGVTQEIEAANTATIEWANNIRDIDWEIFDLIQQRITDITDEADFLIELMSNKDLFDDNGKFTKQGTATVGLHAQNYNTYMYQADLAGEEAAKLKQQLTANPDDTTNLEEQYRQRIAEQREYILAAEDAKNAIIDLVEEGINLEIEALDEKIKKYQDALDVQKDLYDYQKRVEEQTKEISSLQKQISAYEGDDSEETKAKIQELKVSLEEAEADLEETEYDKYITDQQKLLDSLYTEYESMLNERLDMSDDIVRQVIESINATTGENGYVTSALGADGAIATALGGNAATIKETLEKEATNVGAKLSDAMNNIWNLGEQPVLTMYGEGFQNKQTTTNSVLGGIKISVDSMVASLNKEAAKKTTANKTSTSAKQNPITTTNKNNSNTTNKNSSNVNSKTITEDTLKSIAAAIWVHGSKAGWEDDPTRKNKLSAKLGAANAKKVQEYINKYGANGELYRYWYSNNKSLDKYKYSAYKFGAKKIDESQLAWTQEKGQEYIVRPSDGAILTPVAKGDSVLTAQASNNIWQMANSPAEFIKDNLNLSAANVPNNSNVQNSYIQNLDKVVFNMPNVHNYQEFLSEMQKDKNFERLVESMTIGKIAGKSSLAKGKAIR